jgi:hypothetical protein
MVVTVAPKTEIPMMQTTTQNISKGKNPLR